MSFLYKYVKEIHHFPRLARRAACVSCSLSLLELACRVFERSIFLNAASLMQYHCMYGFVCVNDCLLSKLSQH